MKGWRVQPPWDSGDAVHSTDPQPRSSASLPDVDVRVPTVSTYKMGPGELELLMTFWEAITTRVEAAANRVEAIYTRVEAIALFCRPKTLGT